jgi:putative transposase
VKGRKRHILVDTEGLLLGVVALAADIQDWDAAEDLFLVAKPISPRLELVWADSAYGRNELPEWTQQACGWRLEIVSKLPGQRGFVVVPRRWAVERTFAWLCRNRRLSKDYEELAATTEAWVYAAMVRLMLRRLTPQAA